MPALDLTQFPATPASAPFAGDLRQWVSRWCDRLRDAARLHREAATLAGLPDEILLDIGAARRDVAPPPRLILPLDRR